MKHQSCKAKEKGKPSQRSVKRDSTNFKSALPVFGIRDEQVDVFTISERMAFIPVGWYRAIYFLVDTFKSKEEKR